MMLMAHLGQLVHEPRMPQLARDISQAASRAHRVIERPEEWWFYGDCPECDRPLLQERIHKDDTDTPVRCRYPSCEYSAPLDVHHKRMLEASDNRQMTITELVAAFEYNGEPVSRDKIEGLIRHHGLPRERRTKARYVQGRLRTSEVWVYRLGDIRDLLATRQKVSA